MLSPEKGGFVTKTSCSGVCPAAAAAQKSTRSLRTSLKPRAPRCRRTAPSQKKGS